MGKAKKAEKKGDTKKNTLKEVNKKLRFLGYVLSNPDRYIYMDINIFFARFHAALATVGRAGRAFGTTDLLTSLREELRASLIRNLECYTVISLC